jgi:soluble lytic murein transglycosylase-like protein
MSRRTVRVLACALVLCCPTLARAEIVRLSSGAVVSVESCRFEGESVVLELRGGGEVRAAKSLVVDVQADEVPHARPVLVELVAGSKPVAATGAGAMHALVDRLAARIGVDVRLAEAVVQVESNYEPRAVSPKGAMGLMQLMPVVAQQYAVVDPFDPETNLDAGLRYLRSLLDRLSPSNALAAYNAGEATVGKYGGMPPFPETQSYVRRVLALVARH